MDIMSFMCMPPRTHFLLVIFTGTNARSWYLPLQISLILVRVHIVKSIHDMDTRIDILICYPLYNIRHDLVHQGSYFDTSTYSELSEDNL